MKTYQGEPQLAALGDASRRRIIALLSEQGWASVGTLAALLPISRPAVSQHLRVLKCAGLVSARPDGTRRLYSLDSAGVRDLRAYVDHFWREDLERFAAHVRTETAPGAPTTDTDTEPQATP